MDDDGHVIVGTHEGYLHAVSDVGAFLWSYTVDGGLIHGATVDENGRVYAASTDAKLYALGSDGQARWVFQMPERAETPLVVTPKHAVHFATGQALYAVSSKAGMLWGIPLGAKPTGAPLMSPAGETWLATALGNVHQVVTPYRQREFALGAEREPRVLAVRAESALILRGDELLVTDAKGKTLWSRPNVRFAAVDETASASSAWVVSIEADGLVFVDLRSGRGETSIAGTFQLSAAPLVLGDRAFLPGLDGHVVIVERGGTTRRCRVADTALFSPQRGAKGKSVVVAAGEGVVASLWLPGGA